MPRLLLVLVAVVALSACSGSDEKSAAPPAESGGVQDLDNILALRSDFEADAGKTRVLLLFSPT